MPTVTIQRYMAVANGTLPPWQFVPSAESLTTTGTKLIDRVVDVTTSEFTFEIDALGTPGQVILINQDDTNYVRWGWSTGVYGGRVPAGKVSGPFEADAAQQDIFLIADTATCEVRVIVLEA